jgi:predicted NBD/HSP70 family sugar kinase
VVEAAAPSRMLGGRRGPSMPASVRLRNSWLVLDAIRSADTLSRVRLADVTGLTTTTIHRITADLHRRRLIVQVGTPDNGSVGRPPSLFRFNASIGHVIAVDVGNETTRAAIADLCGAVLASRSQPTAAIEGDLLHAIEETIAELQREAGVRLATLVGIGVGVAAVAEAEGRITRASVHHLWEGLELGSQLRRLYACDTLVAQDDHLAALAELEVGAAVGLRDALVLNVGKGIGVGIIADGVVYRGSRSAAGRVGWIPIEDGVTSPPLDMVPLAKILTADGLIAEYRRLGGSAPADGALDVFDADRRGDTAAAGAVDTFADRLGWLIASAVALLDPQRVVLGGGISGSFDRLSERINARLREIVAVPPPVVGSTLGPDAVVSGAIQAALGVADEWLAARLGA